MTVRIKTPDAVVAAIESDKTTLSPVEVGKILGVTDQTIRAMANSGQLEFPTFRNKSRIRIPKIPFLRWLGYDVEIEKE